MAFITVTQLHKQLKQVLQLGYVCDNSPIFLAEFQDSQVLFNGPLQGFSFKSLDQWNEKFKAKPAYIASGPESRT